MPAVEPISVKNLPVPVQRAQTLKSAKWGISARLGIAFFAIAVLAAAANFIGEVGSSIVYTPEVRQAPHVVPPPPAPKPVPISVSEPAAVEIKTTYPGKLLAALQQFVDAVQDRVEANTPDAVDKLGRATEKLTRASRAFDAEARDIVEPRQLKNLRTRVNASASSGQELVRIAEERRGQLKEYLERFETMDVRMKAALERAFKIFGRVIARQSLIDLNGSLDHMRHRLTGFAAREGYDQASIDAIAASEAAFAATLQRTEHGLVRSQGDEWFRRMRADFKRIVELRESLVVLAAQQHAGMERFQIEATSLENLTRAMGNVRREILTDAPKGVAPVPVVAAPSIAEQSLAAPVEAMSTVVAKPVQSIVDKGLSEKERNRRALVAWITAGVLLLVLITSIATVKSIVDPVRRLMRVTRSIASGQTRVRVPRGGVKELDLLAVAFNQMAEQLEAAQAVARQYQGQLEEKVDERTRQLQHLAQHDSLTQLPNRRQLFVYLNAAIERATERGRLVGVLFLDVDNFKNINDSLGHAFGDGVLNGIAQRLRDCIGPNGFAARLGGDEFTVVIEDVSEPEQVLELGQALLHEFQKPLPVEGRSLSISTSVGVSIYPDHEQDAEALLRAADAALFHAKALGRNQLTLFTRDLVEAASKRFGIEQGLRGALERGELELVFQPEIDVKTLEPALVEALLRWRMPDGRLALPGEFLQVAEDCGLIMQVSDWVLDAAIETAAHWHHGEWPEARVAINVSSRQLFDLRFVERVQELLSKHRLPARCIEIELTETVLQTGSVTIDALRGLRALGVAIALDDFGTGYSSIASLEQLPLTRVKLDRSLIASIDTSPRSAAIARSIIGLCHGLGLEVTAEGIERTTQLSMLREYGLYLQGFLLSRPVLKDQLPAAIARLPGHVESLLLESPVSPVSAAPLLDSAPRLERSA
jgi:diguanylate cyclase (GGDEF)-like protein